MTPATAAWSVARLIRNHDATQKILVNSIDELLASFHPSSTLTVKRSLKGHGRFFSYEEHSDQKLRDDKVAQTIEASPLVLARLLNESKNYHYYWTCPIASVPAGPNAASLADDFQRVFQQLLSGSDHSLLDPRGPSLWIGTSGSGTQAHYDVCNNVIVQLHGTKRVRCFPPIVGVTCFHVFPDAHPRARKSQVDFDDEPCRRRYPHFVDVPPPSLDVVLQPGDAVEIPAFWWHHIENGRCRDSSDNSLKEHCKDNEEKDAPSASVNAFSLSRHMMVAQRIFQNASLRPRQLIGERQRNSSAFVADNTMRMKTASAILNVLGTTLVRGLKVVDRGMEEEFIRRNLLDARYSPLRNDGMRVTRIAKETKNKADRTTRECPQNLLTIDQQQAAVTCVEEILPDLRHLFTDEREKGDGTGIALLVGLHLLELWAVELVGACLVAEAWDEALS